MALPWWLATTACAPPLPQSGSLTDRLAFLFLSPCPQRALLGAVDLAFLAVSLVVVARRQCRGESAADAPEREALLHEPKPSLPLFRYALALAASAVFAAASVVLLALALLLQPSTPWRAVELAFLAVHAVAHVVAAWTVVAASGRGAVGDAPAAAAPPGHLRVFWLATGLGAALSSASAVIRGADDSLLFPDDLLTFAGLLVSLPLVYVASTGFTGHGTGTGDVEPEHAGEEAPAMPYAAASFLSRATFSWVNPLISKGYAVGSLSTDDVPMVSAGHRAEASYALFMSNWPAQGSRHPVAVALWLSFWPQFVLTAALGLANIAAMYVGPSLIDQFVEFIRRGGTPWDGLRLVIILLVGKAAQTLASHHYNFQGQLLGMRIRGALQTALYRKSLRLSSGARRAHGTGAIVNYMQVDAGMVSSAMHGLHGLWQMPLQIVVALLLLYAYLGPAVLMTLAVIAAVTVITAFVNKLGLDYQLKFIGARDSRIKALTEMLNHIRVIKLQAWEETFGGKVRELRLDELGWLVKLTFFMCTNNVVFSSFPLAMAVLVFGTYLASGGELDAGKVFTATSFFSMLNAPMRNFPQTIVSSMQAFVSLGRLNKFLSDTEIDSTAVDHVESVAAGAVAVKVQDGLFAWDVPASEAKGNRGQPGYGSEQEMETVLKGINVEVRRGKLTAVVGMVGSGKSSLLSCVMGEMHKLSGKVSICGSTAFVAQTAWIQNGTIQENILFGTPMHPDKYSEVIRACCLEKDIEMMDFGDQTEIGERGINLSGGQKQRIQLARAVYQDCDIYLLDDIFSAVDAHTGSAIFMECLKGILKKKTVILVTHQMDFLQNVDIIFVMKDGLVIQSGIYHELLASCSEFSVLVAAHHGSMEMAEEQGSQVQNTKTSQDTKSSNENGEMTAIAQSKETNSSKLIQEEEKEIGRVSWHVYKSYITEAWGWWGVVVFLAVSLLSEGFSMASNYWLSYETSGAAILNTSLFLGVYVLIVSATIVFGIISTLVVTFSGLHSAQAFFNKMFDSILRAPMSFFDTTPSGRILGRASSDQVKIDIVLVFYVGLATSLCISVVTSVAVTCQVAWPSVIAVLPLLLLNIWYRNHYIATSRELTRLQGVTEAPVIDHLTETFLGAPNVRCFRKENEFYQTNLDRINSNLRMSFHNYAANEWLGFRLELIGTLILCITAFLMISLPSNFIKKEFVGMSLSYGLSLNSLVYYTILISCMVESDMVAVERVTQYSTLPSEAAWEVADCLPSPNWPSRGDIDVNDLKVKYRENTPLILKGITINIKNGEKIGVVGRTGSGKSTLVQALFRLVEPTEGQIIIDGVDICGLGLHDLRSRFGVIPQEPVLFEGTVRSNIDPTGRYSEAEIWQALECCQLKDIVASKPEKLDALVADMGENWSVGQKQLLCFGRVILKRSRILFMDEATASVDSQTDATIQRIIRQEFAECTVISIAHRIPTVMDSDRVLVLDAGLVREFDSPSRLMARPSLFGAMVQEYANRSTSTQLMQLGASNSLD
ncbi:ABC transporter C family member 4 [Dichanthelium oligosanthes]|uniref:ABC transporter C family member 4 n=1 Tax=Dichanthelium oligosanthes TaxID=888268 RepID=A0A1E5V5H5_9POAL|nr:ABC transporter C family member 4 [Dichanthelium oligosanthes]